MSFCFMDWETWSLADLPVVGTMNYVHDASTDCLLLSWAIDEEPIKLWCPDLSDKLPAEAWEYVKSRVDDYGPIPQRLIDFAADDDNYFVAWNMAFDRLVAQHVAAKKHGFPKIEINKTLDAMVQGQASNLPGSLDQAGRALSMGAKTTGGKAIMKRFADASQPLPSDIESWRIYLDYSIQDTELMRKLWRVTRPLMASEWTEYWISEIINDTGMLADLDVCRGALVYRDEEAKHVEVECIRLTNGAIASPTLTKQINTWLFPQLPEAIAEIMVTERSEDGEVLRVSGSKEVVARLLEEVKASDAAVNEGLVDFLELIHFGRSSSAIKFEKILNQSYKGRLSGSYVFNGAGQTGRFSSRGVQMHNLPRSSMNTREEPRRELDILDMIAGQVPIAKLREFGPVASTLSKLIRPTFIAPEGRTLVWGDWASIEARVAPWLANSEAAEETVLAAFRNGSDLYLLNAEVIFNVPYAELVERVDAGDKEAKGMRQAGKVAVLALGFLGSVGALKAMAKGYGMRLSDEEAQKIVTGWRARNGWAKSFGVACEEAAFDAIRMPGAVNKVGRLRYEFSPRLMGGTLLCYLPDGRPIIYPKAKIEKVMKFERKQNVITYLNGGSRRQLWNGLQLENATQATAASILRGTLTRLVTGEKDCTVVGHTHDEVINEVDLDKAQSFAKRLEEVMVEGFDWTDGLPLAAEVDIDWYYHK